MKIIEGTFAGKIIDYKEQKGTRVTSEKVRKAVFDVLKNIIDIEDTKIADIFCGSGMYGLEALSRGAWDVTFIDNDNSVLQLLRSNLDELRVENFKVESGDYERFVKKCNEKFDLVFVDPPYYDFDFQKLNEVYKILNDGGIFVLESSKRIKILEMKNMKLLSEKTYGDTKIYFYKKV
jgi:16S rRNA (guanine(966)-N(2))-methyltransferase RsmD